MSFSWSVWWCFSADEGITLTTRQGREVVGSQHFSTIRAVLKHLRFCHPEYEFKSERFNTHGGLAYAIKGRFK